LAEFLQRPVGLVVPFLVALAVYGAAHAIMDNVSMVGDEPHYVLESWSLQEDLDRDLANQYNGGFFPRWVGPQAKDYTHTGKLISVHSPGLPFLLIPGAAVQRDVQLDVPGQRGAPGTELAVDIEMIVISALVAMMLFRILVQLRLARGLLLYAAWASVAFSLPMVAFSAQIYPEMPAALLLLVGISALIGPPIDTRRTLVVAACAAALPWLHVRFLLFSAVLAGAAIARIVGGSRADSPTSRRRLLALALTPTLISLAVMSVAFHAWYGTFRLDAQFQNHSRSLSYIYQQSMADLFSQELGWLPLAPMHVVALAGLVYLCWRYGTWAIAATAVALVYLVAAGTSNEGFSFPARFLISLIPLAAVPLAAVISNVRPARVLFWLLCIPGFVFLVEGVQDAAALYYDGVSGAAKLWLAIKTHSLWPQLLPPAAVGRFPDVVKTAAWVAGIVFLGWLFVRARDQVRRATV
jgi:hypothetical protein